MIQAMYNGVSGLQAHKTLLDVISNNIANINTIGFKSSRMNFREMLSQTIRAAGEAKSAGMGGTNPMQIGLGVGIGSIDVSQVQGSLVSTGKPTDVAVEGNGFVVLGDGQAKYYTRDGSFQLDSNGNLVSASSGMKVLGWTADVITGLIDTTVPIAPTSGIRLPVGQLSVARQTSNVQFGGSLDSRGGTFGAGIDLYDSLGVPHTVSLTFVKTANDGEWQWDAISPDAAGGASVGTGLIQFDSLGRSLTASGTLSLSLAAANGAVNPIVATMDFSGIKQLAGDTTLMPTSQDGVSLGTLDSFSIDKTGVISGVFTNGMSQHLGQLALALFSNPGGLSKAADNLLVETSNSGLPQIRQPGAGSLGNLTAGFLESSNVDLATEFANMIVAERGFQANSRIITTSDEILQELVQLKR
ncbi:MAG: flagellar hook protein FlgE [Armatimonadota bacterium]|nr:flagellar hook protein FlgE [Armatimonadota bacterium]